MERSLWFSSLGPGLISDAQEEKVVAVALTSARWQRGRPWAVAGTAITRVELPVVVATSGALLRQTCTEIIKRHWFSRILGKQAAAQRKFNYTMQGYNKRIRGGRKGCSQKFGKTVISGPKRTEGGGTHVQGKHMLLSILTHGSSFYSILDCSFPPQTSLNCQYQCQSSLRQEGLISG
jgi:hypothetical protein